jgi:hypothetical protein
MPRARASALRARDFRPTGSQMGSRSCLFYALRLHSVYKTAETQGGVH